MKKHYFVWILFCIVVIGATIKYLLPPPISVVMPVYNREKLVARAINSILNQTYRNFEFIIVDDGSTDNTPSILKSFAQKDRRVKILTNEKNMGIAYSRQKGLNAARGKYVAIMDSDDFSVPTRLEKSIAFMTDHPEVDAMTGDLGDADEYTPTNEYFDPDKPKYKKLMDPGFYEVELNFYNVFPNVSSMYKRSFVKKHNIHYDPDFIAAEDYDFWRQIVMAGGKLASISDLLVYARSHYTNSPQYYTALHDNSLKIHRLMLSRFFIPTDDEIKFGYSDFEKCTLLNKMIQSNRKNPQIPQEYLDNYYADSCPKDMNSSFFLTHPYWSGFIEVLDKKRIRRTGKSSDEGILIQQGDDLIIIWDRWAPETFQKQSDNTYKFIHQNEVTVIHYSDKKEELVFNREKNIACRKKEPYECGNIVQKNKKLHIKWTSNESEIFYKDSDNNWVFSKKTTSVI